MKILFPIDGSYHSDNALESILNQPWPEGSEFVVITVAEPFHNKADSLFGSFGEMAKKAQEALDSDIPKILDETVKKLQAKFGKQKVLGNYYEGKPAKVILEVAKNVKADLIVMGSHGNSGYNDQTFGSTVLDVVDKAPCSVHIEHYIPSVSIEKKQKNHLPIEEARYLLAINDSTAAKAAIDMVSERPWPKESIFQIVSIVPEPKSVFHSRFFKAPEIDRAHKELYKILKQTAEKLVKNSADKIESKFGKGKVTHHVLEGNVRSLILQIAQDWPADMIIIGAHEKDKNILEHFLGSVAQAVINNADCSVEIVRPKI